MWFSVEGTNCVCGTDSTECGKIDNCDWIITTVTCIGGIICTEV